MLNDPLFELKYPIGKYMPPTIITNEQVASWVLAIEELPEMFIAAALSLSDDQLDTPYRFGGWTARQVIHHVPDSHLNSYIRFKWALTENKPTIKAYEETAWAELADTKNKPIQPSLDLLKSVHVKLALLLKSMTPDQMKRTFIHPESGKEISLDWNIGLYAWHGEHHLAHIKSISL